MAPLELTVAAVVAAIIAAEVWFLVASVAFGLAREIKHDGGSCPDGMAVALTRQGEIACMPPGMRLPRLDSDVVGQLTGALRSRLRR